MSTNNRLPPEAVVIGNYEAPGLYDQAMQEVVTDRDDGSHDDGDPNHYEWWYFDALTSEGLKVVVIYLARDFNRLDVRTPPMLSINVETPDGKHREITAVYDGQTLVAATEHCDVWINDNAWCKGRYPHWSIHAKYEDVVVDLDFDATLKSWRAGSGAQYYDAEMTKINGHVVPAPRAIASGTVSIGDSVYRMVNGRGYHDHNWGNVGTTGAIRAWHWGRMECEEFTLNFSYIRMSAKYGNKIVSKFMLGQDSDIVLSSGNISDEFVGELHVSPKFGNVYPDGFLIRAPFNGSEVVVRISSNKLLGEMAVGEGDVRPDAETSAPGYIRLIGDLELTVPIEGGARTVRGTIMHEVAYIEAMPRVNGNWMSE